MEEDSHKHNSTSRLEEALHPPIGNGAGWDTSVNDGQLRQVDSSKQLEPHLLNEQEAAIIVKQWEDELVGESAVMGKEAEGAEKAEKAEEAEEAEEVEREEVVEEAEAVVKTEKPVKTVSKKTPKATDVPVVSLKPRKEEKVKASKRVRKLAETEEKNAAESDRKIRERFASTPEEQLTPFTSWLKGLKGSEYVHPYEDDFAFLQPEGPVREGLSETYADLLASQGYREQAIDMYRRLMEKYPEKNRFFAAKIDALQ